MASKILECLAGIKIHLISQGIDGGDEKFQLLLLARRMIDQLFLADTAKRVPRGLEGLNWPRLAQRRQVFSDIAAAKICRITLAPVNDNSRLTYMAKGKGRLFSSSRVECAKGGNCTTRATPVNSLPRKKCSLKPIQPKGVSDVDVRTHRDKAEQTAKPEAVAGPRPLHHGGL
jgi:hypothetical protein